MHLNFEFHSRRQFVVKVTTPCSPQNFKLQKLCIYCEGKHKKTVGYIILSTSFSSTLHAFSSFLAFTACLLVSYFKVFSAWLFVIFIVFLFVLVLDVLFCPSRLFHMIVRYIIIVHHIVIIEDEL